MMLVLDPERGILSISGAVVEHDEVSYFVI